MYILYSKYIYCTILSYIYYNYIIYIILLLDQAVEKNNDDAKRIMFQKSNKWNSAKDILLTESRQWDLKHHARVKGTYTKRKAEYWDGDICRIRKEKRLLSEPPAPQIDDCDTSHPPVIPIVNPVDYSTLTVMQLKEIIKEKGLNRRGLSKLRKHQLINILEHNN